MFPLGVRASRLPSPNGAVRKTRGPTAHTPRALHHLGYSFSAVRSGRQRPAGSLPAARQTTRCVIIPVPPLDFPPTVCYKFHWPRTVSLQRAGRRCSDKL